MGGSAEKLSKILATKKSKLSIGSQKNKLANPSKLNATTNTKQMTADIQFVAKHSQVL